jgi:predicted  nucleic acid-binding Zn-ribbon protein
MKLEDKTREELIEAIKELKDEIIRLEDEVEGKDNKIYDIKEELKAANKKASDGEKALDILFDIKHMTGVDLLGYHDVEWELSLETTLREWFYERC